MVKIKKIHTRQRTKKKMLVRECNLSSEANSMVKITKSIALERTKKMLKREWKLENPPLSNANLRNELGRKDAAIRALETPIETNDFIDVEADVVGSNLIKAKTVMELRDQILAGIPDSHKPMNPPSKGGR